VQENPIADEYAERNLVGSMLLAGHDAIGQVAPLVDAGMLTDARNRVLFETLCELAEAQQPIDLVVLKHWLNDRGLMAQAGGVEHLVRVTETVGSSANAAYYAGVVRSLACRRRVLSGLEVAQGALAGPRQEGDTWQDEARRHLTDLGELVDAETASQGQTMADVLDRLATTPRVTIRTGFSSIDTRWGGMALGELWYLAGRPSMGKSSLANCMAADAAKQQHSVVVFSQEMKPEDWTVNALARFADVSGQAIRRAQLTDDEQERMANAITDSRAWMVFVQIAGWQKSVRSLLAEARRIQQRMKIELIVVDYVQLLSPGKKVAGIYEAVTEVSHKLKQLARELNVVVLACCQISRASEHHRDKCPLLSDLKGSGDLEQDADGVLILHRPEYYHPNNEGAKGKAQLICAKNRNGPTGEVWLKWEPTRFDFRDLVEESWPPDARQRDRARRGEQQWSAEVPF